MIDTRLLIVDDDEDTCSNLTDILTDCGYTVDVACRGEQGLDLFGKHPYRLALLDYRLPSMTGVELFQRMRQVRADVEGMLVTGIVSSEATSAALAAGMCHVINKPIDPPKLVALIEQALV